MTREEFKKVLDAKSYKWKEEGEWIILEEPHDVIIKYIGNNVQFNNLGYVNLPLLKSIPDNLDFNNGGDVYLNYLESMRDNVEFRNGGDLYLDSLKSIGDNVQFNNGGYVVLDSLKSIPINLDSEEIFKNEDDIKINGKWLDLEKNIPFLDSRWKSVDTGKVQMYESWIKNNY